MDDRQLMEKYRLSAQGLQSLFSKMVQAGVISKEELDERVPPIEKTVELGFICTACGNIQSEKFKTCPRCGFESHDYSRKPTDKARLSVASKKASTAPSRAGKKTPPRSSSTSVKVEPTSGAGYGEPDFSKLNGARKLLRALGVISLGVYLLVVICLFLIIDFMPNQSIVSSAELSLAVFVLQLPALVIVMTTFVSIKILSEATQAFIQVAKRPDR